MQIPSALFRILKLWIFSLLRCSAGEDCRTLKLKPAQEGIALQGHLLKNNTVKIKSACLAQCYAEENCLSYNVGRPVDGNHQCELSNSDHVMHPKDLVLRQGFVYQPFENACHSRPCPDNSVCQNGFNEKGYRCMQGLLPFVTIMPRTEITEVGKQVTFTCTVTGQFNPEVTWDRLQGSLPDSRSILSIRTLTIWNVNKDDSGFYVCTATSIMGSNSSTVRLVVYAGIKSISRSPSSVLLYSGQTLNLSCSTSGDPEVNISWMFDGTPSLPQGAIITSLHHLIVLSANSTHGGNYSCTATNTTSSLQAEFIVRIKYPETCSRVKADISDVSADYLVDPDGDQGEAPFAVYCNMTVKGGVGVTVVSHDSENRTHVIGFEEHGAYSRNIRYIGSNLSQLKALTEASAKCEQFIKYECYSALLSRGDNGFWLSRDGQKMTNWGGVPYGHGCACGMNNTCANPKYPCNCDKNDSVWREDSGLLTNRSHLPVSQLRFGDTGGYETGVEEGYHTLGKLFCYGTN